MQTEAPEVFDIRKESKATLELYGPGSTARSCLMAVRLIEKGVRMVQVYYGSGDPWDAHGDLYSQHRKPAFDSDRPCAAVIKDLKSRGLFEDTIVVCGSEFGRTPVAEIGAGGNGLLLASTRTAGDGSGLDAAANNSASARWKRPIRVADTIVRHGMVAP